MITIIVATAKNGVIGNSNDIPWYVPADLKYFSSKTRGNTVVMGQKTFESILARINKPLPDRKTIVLSLDKNFSYPGIDVYHSIEHVLEATKGQDFYVAGGATIYKLMLPHTDRMLITEVDADIKGDAFFTYNPDEWVKVSEEKHSKDEKNQFDYAFCVYERKK